MEAEKFQQPCIHARLGEWIDLYEVAANANVGAEGGEEFIHEAVQEENDDLRALLHGLLEAMGKHMPCIIHNSLFLLLLSALCSCSLL
jgi:hypothetical protein